MDEFDFWCLFSIILLGLQIYSSYKFIQYCERKLNISIRGNQQTESTRKLYMEPLPSTSSEKLLPSPDDMKPTETDSDPEEPPIRFSFDADVHCSADGEKYKNPNKFEFKLNARPKMIIPFEDDVELATDQIVDDE